MWLASVKLSLNLGKTEIILLGSRQLIGRCPIPVIQIDGVAIHAKPFVRDLGVIIDQHLTFERHVSQVSSSAFSHLRVIARVRRSLTMTHLSMVIHALVISRISYCSSIFYKVSSQQRSRLQRIINAALRLFNISRAQVASGQLNQLKLLAVEDLSQLRLSTIIFSTIRTGYPKYLSNQIELCTTQNLRSSDNGNLIVRRSNSVLGARAFAIYAPTVWNSIPVEIRRCKSAGAFKEKMREYLTLRQDQ
jgi:hypothetical protein